MKEIKLKECPCCEGKAEFECRINFVTEQVRAKCSKCKLSTEWVDESVNYYAKEEAAKVWNRREGKQLKCPTCEEEGLCITQFNYISNKMSAKIHCDICGTDIEIPDIKKCTGALSELIFNEK